MKVKYQTIDGRIFCEPADAEAHEQEILQKVQMWNWEKERTNNTACAKVVHLIGDGAAVIFKAMVQANEEDWMSIDDSVIDDEDTGWFYWDEYAETYRYIDSDLIDIFVAATHQI